MKRLAGIVFGVALAAACLWFVLRGVEDPARLRALVVSADPLLLALLVASVGGHIVLRSLRWRTLLCRPDVPLVELASATSIGYMASLLPARVGEVIRPVALARRTDVPLGTAIASVAVERVVLDLAVVLLFLGAALVAPAAWTGLGEHTDAATLATIRVAGTSFLAVVAIGLAGVVVAARRREWVSRRLAPYAAPGGTGAAARLARGVARAVLSLIPGLAAFRSAGRVARLAAESIVLWAIVGAGLHAGVSACGVELAPLAALLIVPVTAVGIAAGTPGGAGTYQVAMVAVLAKLLGAPRDAAIAAGFVVHIVQIVPVLVIGGVFLLRGGLASRRADGGGLAPLQGAAEP